MESELAWRRHTDGCDADIRAAARVIRVRPTVKMLEFVIASRRYGDAALTGSVLDAGVVCGLGYTISPKVGHRRRAIKI